MSGPTAAASRLRPLSGAGCAPRGREERDLADRREKAARRDIEKQRVAAAEPHESAQFWKDRAEKAEAALELAQREKAAWGEEKARLEEARRLALLANEAGSDVPRVELLGEAEAVPEVPAEPAEPAEPGSSVSRVELLDWPAVVPSGGSRAVVEHCLGGASRHGGLSAGRTGALSQGSRAAGLRRRLAATRRRGSCRGSSRAEWAAAWWTSTRRMAMTGRLMKPTCSR